MILQKINSKWILLRKQTNINSIILITLLRIIIFPCFLNIFFIILIRYISIKTKVFLLEYCLSIQVDKPFFSVLRQISKLDFQIKCNSCKTSENVLKIILLKCGCKYCYPCFKKYLFYNLTYLWFRIISDSSIKSYLFEVCHCLYHKIKFP